MPNQIQSSNGKTVFDIESFGIDLSFGLPAEALAQAGILTFEFCVLVIGVLTFTLLFFALL